MAYVPVPKDLTKVKTKVAFNLTKRQIICFTAALIAGLPVFFLLKGSAGTSLATFNVIEKKGFFPARAEKAFATVKVKPPDKGENAHTEGTRSGGKTALTEVQPLAHGVAAGKNFTLVSVKIKTGKTHQIREIGRAHV